MKPTTVVVATTNIATYARIAMNTTLQARASIATASFIVSTVVKTYSLAVVVETESIQETRI